MNVEFDLHGYVGVRLIGADARDRQRVVAQLGPIEGPLAREPDITIRFVDRIEHGPLTYVSWQESAFDDQSFLLLNGRGRVRGKASIPFEDLGAQCEIVCERGLPAVPHLVSVVNLTALAKGVVPLHASAFVHDGRGVLATGWAKGGKTEVLLAFAARGARYVGDEWVYLTPDRRMFGIPEPIRLWGWQIRQMPALAARLRRGDRARVGLLDGLAAVAERLTPARSGGPAGSLLRRGTPVLRRQASVRVPPDRLFGPDRVPGPVPIDRLVFASSHRAPTVLVDQVDASEVVERMSASLAYERAALRDVYEQFRFAFPGRPSAILDRAATLEAELLRTALGSIPASWVHHPYPCQIDSLYEPIASSLRAPMSAIPQPA